MAKFRVVRPHEGDRFYNVGDVREGDARAFKHLIPNVLEPLEESAPKPAEQPKSEEPGGTKSLPGAPENKAEAPEGSKAGNRPKGGK